MTAYEMIYDSFRKLKKELKNCQKSKKKSNLWNSLGKLEVGNTFLKFEKVRNNDQIFDIVFKLDKIE